MTVAPRLWSISICIKLNVRPVLIIRSNDSVVFDEISLAPSNMDADSMESARRPFRKPCWLPDKRPAIRIDLGDCGIFYQALVYHHHKRIIIAID